MGKSMADIYAEMKEQIPALEKQIAELRAELDVTNKTLSDEASRFNAAMQERTRERDEARDGAAELRAALTAANDALKAEQDKVAELNKRLEFPAYADATAGGKPVADTGASAVEAQVDWVAAVEAMSGKAKIEFYRAHRAEIDAAYSRK